MRTHVTGLRVAGVGFGLLTAAQVARLFIRPRIEVNGYELPLWPSVFAVVIFGCLCVWMLRLANQAGKP